MNPFVVLYDSKIEYLIEWKKTWVPRSQLDQCSRLIEKYFLKVSAIILGC